MEPDGPEEREAFYDEAFERDLEQEEIAEQLADESYDAAFMEREQNHEYLRDVEVTHVD